MKAKLIGYPLGKRLILPCKVSEIRAGTVTLHGCVGLSVGIGAQLFNAMILDDLGARTGQSLVEVGGGAGVELALQCVQRGMRYDGFEVDPAYRENFTGELDGLLHTGEFSSGTKSVSRSLLEDHSRDYVVMTTGALSDPRPVSSAREVFHEALRVVRNGGCILVGSYVPSWEMIERSTALKLMNSVLKAHYRSAVMLEEMREVSLDVFCKGILFRVHHLQREPGFVERVVRRMLRFC